MLRPLGDHILVRPGEAEEVTASGIVLPDTAQKRPREGDVLAVGPGKLLDNGQRAPLEITVGDTIIYREYGGTEVTLGGEDYVILDQDSVLAVRTDEKKAKRKKS